MSLINEALKKAQRQRTLEAAPLSGAPSGVAAAAVTTHVAAASHRRSLAPLWFGLGLLALGVGATVLVMNFRFEPAPSPTQVAATAPAAVASTTIPPPPTQPPVPVVEAPTAIVTLPPITPPPVAVAAPVAPQPVAVSLPPPTPPPATAPIQPAQAVAPVTPVAITPAPTSVAPVVDSAAEKAADAARSARVYDFLNTLRLTGVRGLGAEARVLMNERVWRLNDVVSPELGLRLSAVRPGLLVFTDAAGRTYEKPH